LEPNCYLAGADGETLSLLLNGRPYYHEVVGWHDCRGWGEGAAVGVGRRTARKRAIGTRERIIAYLNESGSLSDVNGMASTQLAAAVGYPGSSVAFAQLLSGMERSGLIEREVRGKRTYRISLGSAQAGGAVLAGGPGHGDEPGHAPGPFGRNHRGGERGAPSPDADAAAGFDYDELARRLLVQVVRRLAAAGPEASPPDRPAPADQAALQQTVSGLEYELATAWSKHGKLAEENVRLREQLRAAQRSLAMAAEQVRRLPVSSDLDSSEVVLLQRLLAAGDSGASDSQDDSGQEGLAEAPSLLG
jgi:hypothetical protein